MQEKTVKSSEVFRGKIINVKVDTVTLPDGRQTEREVVEHPGAVAVVALTEDEEVLLVSQFRYPVGEILLEVPAGKLEPGEDPLESAKRELAEETGFMANSWELLSVFYTTPGFSNEIMYLYLARDLSPDKKQADDDEFIELQQMPLKDAVSKALSGHFKDAKTIAGILIAGFRSCK